jgi:outer membrane immunogenic protein
MKRILLATVTIAALGSANALAADMGQRPVYKAPVMMAPAPTWTGCYFGGNIGGAFGDASLSGPG